MHTESIFLGFTNQILQVSCVAVLAVFVTTLTKGTRPHLVHAIWLIVLLKCVTPPIVSSPLSHASSPIPKQDTLCKSIHYEPSRTIRTSFTVVHSNDSTCKLSIDDSCDHGSRGE